MSSRAIFNVLVALGAVVAIVVVAAPKIDIGGDSGDTVADDSGPPRAQPATSERETTREDLPEAVEEPAERKQALPENPDEVKGNQEISLHRPRNLRRALGVLERVRSRAEGVFDGLRVAPGRIDTTVNTPTKKIHLQIRANFEIAFRSDSDFPNAGNPRWRKSGLGAEAVRVTLPARMLRRIDRRRSGSAARDLDYFVIRRDIIDFEVNYGAYLRSGSRPRIFLLEPGEPFRAIG